MLSGGGHQTKAHPGRQESRSGHKLQTSRSKCASVIESLTSDLWQKRTSSSPAKPWLTLGVAFGRMSWQHGHQSCYWFFLLGDRHTQDRLFSGWWKITWWEGEVVLYLKFLLRRTGECFFFLHSRAKILWCLGHWMAFTGQANYYKYTKTEGDCIFPNLKCFLRSWGKYFALLYQLYDLVSY